MKTISENVVKHSLEKNDVLFVVLITFCPICNHNCAAILSQRQQHHNKHPIESELLTRENLPIEPPMFFWSGINSRYEKNTTTCVSKRLSHASSSPSLSTSVPQHHYNNDHYSLSLMLSSCSMMYQVGPAQHS